MIGNKAFAKAMRENAVINDYGQIICSPELWESIANRLENSMLMSNCKDDAHPTEKGGASDER